MLYGLTIFGLFLDLLGAFFLAIEAIKLENFHRLYAYLAEVRKENVLAALTAGAIGATKHRRISQLIKKEGQTLIK